MQDVNRLAAGGGRRRQNQHNADLHERLCCPAACATTFQSQCRQATETIGELHTRQRPLNTHLRVGDNQLGPRVRQHRLQGAQEAGALRLHQRGVGAAVKRGLRRVGTGVGWDVYIGAVGSEEDQARPCRAASAYYVAQHASPKPTQPPYLRACARFMR